jgi:hypothetical protein
MATAASVSGVGQGSADKAGQKGSEHQFLGVDKLVGPRIVRAGTGVTAGNDRSATIVFPATLSGVTADYVVLLTNVNSTTAAQGVHINSITSSGGAMTGFVASSDTAATTFHWAVVRVNNATVQVN